MASNITSELNAIARDLTKLIRDELTRQGLVKTGALNKSIQARVVKSPQGYTFTIESLDYFSVLDEKYGVTDKVFASKGFQDIQEKIADIMVQQILDDLETI